LSNAIEEWLALHDKNNHPKSDDMPWLTWKESAVTLLQCLLGDDYRLNERCSSAWPLWEDSQGDRPFVGAPCMRQNASMLGDEAVNQQTISPNSMEESYSDWEPLLLNAGYEYAYFDGLNKHYVAGEHENLKAAFKAPPNVFDDFVRSERLETELRAREVEAKVKEVEQRASEAEARAHEAETKAREAEERAAQAEERVAQVGAATHEAWKQANEWRERALALHNSNSWKITAPLRALGRIVRRQSTAAESFAVGIAKLRQFTRARVVSTVIWAGDRARTFPNLKRFALWLLRAHPGLQQKLRSIYLRSQNEESQNEDQPQPVNWSGTSADLVMPLDLGVSGGRECVLLGPGPRGINADQRTPLESSFHSYSGKP
jgi:hypothetical protein